MKKKIWILIVTGLVLLAILFVPIPTGVCRDGGTRSYTALTYKVVDWNHLMTDGVYDKTIVYWFPNNFKSIDALWDLEKENAEYSLTAAVLEINGNSVLVQPMEGEKIGVEILLDITELGDIGASVGSIVEITYFGDVMETAPAQIHATSWKLASDLRHLEYTGQWLDKSTAEKYDNNIFDHIIITKIYSNCFFAKTVIPMPYEIKMNGSLSDEWCVGDQITCTYENTYYDEKHNRVEADMVTVEASDWEPNPYVAYKPVIYLYPEKETEVLVKLILDGNLTCTYPKYHDGWTVTASPDGTLTDANGQIYNYLYWEGETGARYDLSEGFCIRGEDTAVFLEEALEKLGLNRREANEFIVYWLPLMEQNPYNVISFQTDIYTDAARLEIVPTPDTLIRVFMAWQASDVFVDLPAQELNAPERFGFTAIEWGGTEIE